MIIAYQMLGGPVTREHGGPVRLYVAPMYGYKSIKWLSTISVVDQSRARVLGGQRLRRQRLDRPEQRSD